MSEPGSPAVAQAVREARRAALRARARRRREWMLAVAGCSVAVAMIAVVLRAWPTPEAATPSLRASSRVASGGAEAPAAAARGGEASQLAGSGSASASSPSQTPNAGRLTGAVIVVDPGHNPGNNRYPSEINRLVRFGAGMKPCDTTGTATADGYAEAAYTLDVSYRVVALLRAQGATVVLTHTRTSPVWGPCITERAAIGNRSHAAAAISIHADGGPASGRGFAAIIPAAPLPSVGLTSSMIAADLGLALDVRNAYVSATGMTYSSYLGSQGVYHSNAYGGTNLSRVPKIFIETGNMRNATDAALLESAVFRERAARGIASGIARFVSRR